MGGTDSPGEDFAAAFDAAAARLRAAVDEACAGSGPWPARVCAAIEAVLAFAYARPAAMRLLLVEPWLRGGEALARHERLLDGFATLLASGREENAGGSELPAHTEHILLAGFASALAAGPVDRAETGKGDSPSLAPELAEFVLLPYLGQPRARAWARLWRAPPRLSGSGPPLLRPLEFTAVLTRLQGLIGAEAQLVINLSGHFFDCGFRARLQRVDTLSGSEGPVLLVFDGGHGLAIDPAEIECFLALWPTEPGYAWLELHLADRLHLVIEPLSEPADE